MESKIYITLYLFFIIWVVANKLEIDALSKYPYLFLIIIYLSIFNSFIKLLWIFRHKLFLKKSIISFIWEFIRLIGPHKPTSKLFATYLFFSLIIIELNKKIINKKLYLYLNIIIVILALLTLSRPGIYAIAFVIINYLYNKNEKVLSVIILILSIFLVFFITSIHPEINESLFN